MYKTRPFLKRRVRVIVLSALLGLLAGAGLCYTGVLWPNTLFISGYTLRGIDVSNHQKHIDWATVARTKQYSFAFIKATEGAEYRDAYFQDNWRQTKAQGLLRGAYHFYTASLSGIEQANHFISVVPREAGMLPPVLDLEVSSSNSAAMVHEIRQFLDRLEQYYGLKPMIYTDQARYTEYVKGNFDGYPLWISNIVTPPEWFGEENWTFWQYCDRGHVAGISEYVDLNVFYGDRGSLLNLSTSK